MRDTAAGAALCAPPAAADAAGGSDAFGRSTWPGAFGSPCWRFRCTDQAGQLRDRRRVQQGRRLARRRKAAGTNFAAAILHLAAHHITLHAPYVQYTMANHRSSCGA